MPELRESIKNEMENNERSTLAISNCFSMTGENHCYEKAMADRVIGILKDEFYLDHTSTDVAHAKRAVISTITLCNEI